MVLGFVPGLLDPGVAVVPPGVFVVPGVPVVELGVVVPVPLVPFVVSGVGLGEGVAVPGAGVPLGVPVVEPEFGVVVEPEFGVFVVEPESGVVPLCGVWVAVPPVLLPWVELGLLGEVLEPVWGVVLWPFIVPVADGEAVLPAVPDWLAVPAVPELVWASAKPAVTSRAAGISSKRINFFPFPSSLLAVRPPGASC